MRGAFACRFLSDLVGSADLDGWAGAQNNLNYASLLLNLHSGFWAQLISPGAGGIGVRVHL